MKKVLSKISSIALACLGIFHGCCFADAVVMDPVPSNKLISPKPVNTVAINETVQKVKPVKAFIFTPIIIGIIVAVIVLIAIIVLLSGKKNKDEN